MLLLSRMLKSTIKNGTLTLVDVNGGRHVFGNNQAPAVTLRLHDKKLYRSLVFRPELAAGEGYMDGAITFEDGSAVRDLLLSLIHISEPTRRTPISYAVFC